MGTIVVGVDGSRGSRTALEFAFAEARLRGATVRAVFAWSLPFVADMSGALPALLEGYRDDAERVLAETVKEAGPEGVDVELVVVEGTPGRVLVDESAGADLLVVGSRGHGGFTGLLLGSVSQQCAHHARCPVIIVPAARSG